MTSLNTLLKEGNTILSKFLKKTLLSIKKWSDFLFIKFKELLKKVKKTYKNE